MTILNNLDLKAIKMAKAITADAVEKTGNGHPGSAISIAPAAYLLYQKHLRSNPKNPQWDGRDRFILSMGHSSLTQYLQLYLGGFGLELDDIKHLRTMGSLTPGHPEYKHTAGVEMTTGPLGQGLATAVGFAYGQRYQRGLLDPDTPLGESPFDYNVYVLTGDGCLEEGISQEAASLAGLQKLGNLIVLWDNNHITIEDNTKIAFTENVLARYEADGWHTQKVDWTATGEYNEDLDTLNEAIEKAKKVTDKPSIISLKTLIAWPSPTKTNSGSSHGAALGSDEVKGLKVNLGLDPNKNFQIDEQALAQARKLITQGENLETQWQEKLTTWKSARPDKVALYERMSKRQIPDITNILPTFSADENIASRASSGKVINAIAKIMPEFWGGSADLAGSNNTTIEGAKSFAPVENATDKWSTSPYGRVLHFGVREHAMAAIINGITLTGGTKAFGGTFFQFADYMRPACRLAALMGIPSIYIWTHDSIAVGEDGPTHQPVEHLAAMRAIPNFNVVRPADANEVSWAWKGILETQTSPSGLILTRQTIPTFPRDNDFQSAKGTLKGGYILLDTPDEPDVILLATGSEVQLAIKAAKMLGENENIQARVVSMPCFEWFDKQTSEYKELVLPSNIKARVSVEAGIAMPWYKYISDKGIAISLEHFGESAAPDQLFTKYGITAEAIYSAALATIAKNKKN
ncbi:MAG: transketolase [Bifidobacteriaceae bacterium]|jgi:transketolase|nr:transketolase [Bifidobacteriaceae bacterium]